MSTSDINSGSEHHVTKHEILVGYRTAEKRTRQNQSGTIAWNTERMGRQLGSIGGIMWPDLPLNITRN